MLKLVFFFGLFFSLRPAYSQQPNQCPQKREFKEIDFQHEFGPQRLQGGVGWCFAFAGADLLTHYLYSHGEISGFSDSEIVSATAVALMTTQKDEFDRIEGAIGVQRISDELFASIKSQEAEKLKVNLFLKDLKIEKKYAWGEKLERLSQEIRRQEKSAAELRQKIDFTKREVRRLNERFEVEYNSALEQGGHAVYAAQLMAETGVCTESRVRSSYLDTFELLPLGLTDHRGRPDKLKILNNLVQFQNEDRAKAYQAMFSGLNFESIAETIRSESPQKLPFTLLEKACEAKPVKNLPAVKWFSIDDETKPKATEIATMFSIIDSQVEQKNVVAFSTDGDIFDRSGKPFSFETRHAVLIVGKRFNCEFNEPEYIIRNSWGPNSCDNYLSYFRRESNYTKRASERIENKSLKCREKCLNEDQDEADTIRNCLDACVSESNRRLVEVNKPPYYCENGNYVVRKSHLQKGSSAIRYLVPSR